MLTLTRKENESVIINGQWEVKVLAIKGSRVRIAFGFPNDIPIVRTELLTATSANQENHDHDRT